MPQSVDADKLRAVCRARLAALSKANGKPLPDRWLRQVVHENIARGRFERLASSQSTRHPLSLADYVDRVIANSVERARVSALERGDAAAWTQLRDFLARRAFRAVQRFRNAGEAITAAHDFANDACLILFEERYPFDVSFDAWAATILKNLILAKYTRSTDALDRRGPPESLDAPRVSDQGAISTLGDFLSDGHALMPFEKIEDQSALRDLVSQLHSRTQQQVLLLTYIDGLDDAEIARRLGRSKQAVYNLRNRAIAKLKANVTKTTAKEKGAKSH